MDEELKRIRKQNRRMWIMLILLTLLILGSTVLLYKDNPKSINYVTQTASAPVDYSKIFSYLQRQLSAIPAPQNGINGSPGAAGAPGALGLAGITGATGATGNTGTQGATGANSSVPGPVGPAGSDGQNGVDGRTPVFQCNPTTHDYEMQYVGDEDWTIIQPNSKTCYSENE
jgi:hypothetical protein